MHNLGLSFSYLHEWDKRNIFHLIMAVGISLLMIMEFNLAQISIARILAPIDSPIMADFVANWISSNALVEKSTGFIPV